MSASANASAVASVSMDARMGASFDADDKKKGRMSFFYFASYFCLFNVF